MANSATHALYVVTLIIYAALSNPALFTLWKHGRHGILGWFYLQLFCVVRGIGSIVELVAISKGTTNSTAVVIVQSVGLSPLLLAALGILHEARRARMPNLRGKLEWFLVINLHVIVSASLIAVIIGIVNVEKDHTKPSDSHVIKFGLAVIFICWITLFTWAVFSLRAQIHTDPLFYGNGSALLHGVIAAMPFIGCRLVYGILSFTLSNPSFGNSLGAKIALSVIPEVIVVVILVMVGLATRNMYKQKQRAGKAEAGYPFQESYRPRQQNNPGQVF